MLVTYVFSPSSLLILLVCYMYNFIMVGYLTLNKISEFFHPVLALLLFATPLGLLFSRLHPLCHAAPYALFARSTEICGVQIGEQAAPHVSAAEHYECAVVIAAGVACTGDRHFACGPHLDPHEN